MRPSRRIDNVRYLTLVADDASEDDNDDLTGAQALYLALVLILALVAVVLVTTYMGVN